MLSLTHRRILFVVSAAAVAAAGLLLFAFKARAAAPVYFETQLANFPRAWGFTYPKPDSLYHAIAQKYIPQSDQILCRLSMKMSENGTPYSDVMVKVYQGGSVPGAGAYIGQATVLADEFAISFGAIYRAFNFSPCVPLNQDSVYWFSFSKQKYDNVNIVNSSYRDSNQEHFTSAWRQNVLESQFGIWVEESAREWALKLEGPDPPGASELEQFDFDSVALLENSTTTQGRVTLNGRVTSPANKRLKLEVELSTSTFASVATAESELTESSSTVTVAISNLPDGDYLWQARAVDEDGVVSPWLVFGASSTTDFHIRRIPVLIVPGILGTELLLGDDLIWADLLEMLTDINDEFIPESIGLDQDGNSINEITVGEVIKVMLGGVRFAEVNTFADVEELLEKNNYIVDSNLFFFPYDWRFDLENTKELLKEKINEIKAKANSEKVKIISHSMGGLLVKDYLDEYGKSNVDTLIFVGTPHLGAPKAGKTLLVGHNFDIPMLDPVAMKAFSLNAVSVYELLPNEKYFSEPGYINKASSPALNYSETKDFLLAHNVNENLLDQSQDFFDKDLPDIDLSGIETYNIVGCKTATEAGYRFSADEQEIEAIREISGDKTVPLSSADYINISIENKFYFKNGSHAKLPSAEPVRNLILNILENTTSTLPSDLAQGNTAFCNIKGKELIWHSPVEVHVYDELGNHTGPAADNSIEYNIPGVDYSIIGHNKFIFLPTDTGHTYRIVSSATAAGTFDLFIRENDNGAITSTKLFNDIAITTSSSMEFNVSSESADTDLVIQDGDTTRTVTSTIASDISDGDVVITVPVLEEAASSTELATSTDPFVIPADPSVIASSSLPIAQAGVAISTGGESSVIPAEAGIQSSNPIGPGGSTYTPPTPIAQVLGASMNAEEAQKQAILEQLIVLLQQLFALYLELFEMIQ